jgi:ABC-type transport system involved in multi-copper enzyme maturation permease subunit
MVKTAISFGIPDHPGATGLASVRATLLHQEGTLYIEELRATMRGRFAWLGAAVVLLLVGGLATAGTQDNWLDGYGILAYGLLPLAFIPMTAAMIAGPRANRFVECVFTAPVRRRDWLAAKLLVIVTLAAFYYAALIPMMLVYTAHVGVPPLLHKFLIWTPGLLLVSIAAGTLIGVLFIGRSLAAPAGTGMGVLLAYAAMIPLQELMVAQGNGATRSGHIALASPAVLLKNALGFTLVAARIPSTTVATWISLGVFAVGTIALAAWVFLRTQGVETWEATGLQRWTMAGAIVVLVAVPVIFADVNYDTQAPRPINAPVARGAFSRNGPNLALVAHGAPVPLRCCFPLLNRDEWPYPTDRSTERDLLLLLPVDTSAHLTNLQIRVAGEIGLQVSADPAALAEVGQHLETRRYPNDSGPPDVTGRHVADGWIVRVPVSLYPTHPWDIGGDRYPLNITATYNIDGQPHTFTSRAAIDAGMANAIYEMALAAIILPLLCFIAAFVRWRRTR